MPVSMSALAIWHLSRNNPIHLCVFPYYSPQPRSFPAIFRLSLKTWVSSPSARRALKRQNCPVAIVDCRSDGSAPSIHGEIRAVNEAGTVCGKEDNRFSNFVGRCRTTGGGLGSELVEPLAHHFCALRTRGPGTHCVHADTLRSILGSPGFGQQIDGGLARTLEAHSGRSVIGDHR
jgi:hypothetical protein